ncbi:MAG: hypothetical protein M1570_18880 [Chloroflexi bacterium]|nr:hypothetical protein [Chloroflexota bacterium]
MSQPADHHSESVPLGTPEQSARADPAGPRQTGSGHRPDLRLGRHRSELLALTAYLLLAVVLTFPLVLHLTTHVAGDGSDDPALAWNLWWVPYALIHLGSSPIYTNYMFYPIGLNLAFYTLTLLNAFVALPLQLAFNLVVAANVNLLLSFVLGGFGTYLLVQYLLRNEKTGDHPSFLALAAFAAGALYAFSSNKMLYASLGQFNIASSQWIPFYILFLLKLTRAQPSQSEIKAGFLLGLFLLFQTLSEFIFGSFLILFTVIYLVYWSIANRRRWNEFRFAVRGFAVATVVFVIPMAPILAAMFQDMRVEGDFLQSRAGFADVFSNDLLGFLVPSHLNPLLGSLQAPFHFAYTNFAYLGFAALALAVVALWKVKAARIWGLFAAIFLLITLGPELRIDGQAWAVPFLPFNLLLQIPIVNGNRYPSRWSVMLTLALAILVGYGLQWASEKLKVKGQRWALVLPFAFLLLTCTEHLSVPLPLSDFKIPAVYGTIAQDKGDFSVLEIPLAWRNGFRMTGPLDQEMMFEQWYQTEHAHPILGGNTSRNPELKFQYFAEAPVINSLIAIETGYPVDNARREKDKQLAPEVLRFFGVRYVVWHSAREKENEANLEAARTYVEETWPVTKFYDVSDETGETVAYRVDPEGAPSQVEISSSAPLARLYFGEGWGALSDEPLVWAQRSSARLFVPLDTKGRAAQLSFQAVLPPSLDEQRVTVIANGEPAGQTVITRCGDCENRVAIPGRLLKPGMNELVLQFERVAPVAGTRMASGNLVSSKGPASPVNIVVRSAGQDQGDFAHIIVDGNDVSPNGRGYNVVVLNPQSGAVEASASFDTFSSASESARLAQFVDRIPSGRIVLVAVRDEASRYLTAAAVDALHSIGATQDLRGKFRWSHAVIGVKGAAPGSAREAVGETAPAQLVLGIGATEPNLAAGFKWIRVEAK